MDTQTKQNKDRRATGTAFISSMPEKVYPSVVSQPAFERGVVMANLLLMTLRAENFQSRWNDWDKRKEALFRHGSIIEKMMSRYRMETVCTECNAIMDTSFEQIDCIECGSHNTVSPYYC